MMSACLRHVRLNAAETLHGDQHAALATWGRETPRA